MKSRLLIVAFAAFLGAASSLLAQNTVIGAIMNLRGKVDSANALMVTAYAAQAPYSSIGAISNLLGKVDSSNNLVVGLAGMFAGTGTAQYQPGGIISGCSGPNASVGTDADLLEKTLFTCTVPANTLVSNNSALRIHVNGTTAANVNAKTVRIKFGAASYTLFSGAVNGSQWHGDSFVIRRSTNVQVFEGRGGFGSSNSTMQASLTAETETGALSVLVTGQNGVATANDIVLYSAFVEYLPEL